MSLPVFVITTNNTNKSLRDVRYAWVRGWNDRDETFDVMFGEIPPSNLVIKGRTYDEENFTLTESGTPRQEARPSTRLRRRNQAAFKRDVFARYEAKCAVCGIVSPSLLDAAHLKPKRLNGTDDPRNGLVLCATHHKALDNQLYCIEPQTLKIVIGPEIDDLLQLSITKNSIKGLRAKPHPEALRWLWGEWKRRNAIRANSENTT